MAPSISSRWAVSRKILAISRFSMAGLYESRPTIHNAALLTCLSEAAPASARRGAHKRSANGRDQKWALALGTTKFHLALLTFSDAVEFFPVGATACLARPSN